MSIKPVGNFVSPLVSPQSKPTLESNAFEGRLRELLSDVDQMLDRSAQTQKQFVVGEATDVHEVMIASEEASLALTLIVEVRNRLVEAYQELTRMQV